MNCERCNINKATHHIKENINGTETRKYLCASCAAELVGAFKIFGGGILPSFLTDAAPVHKAGSSPVCKACGTALSEFNESAYLGCQYCYREFEDYLEPVLKRLHGADVRHVGKVPKRVNAATAEAVGAAAERARLVRLLERARDEERFEDAAKYRDLIREMDNK